MCHYPGRVGARFLPLGNVLYSSNPPIGSLDVPKRFIATVSVPTGVISRFGVENGRQDLLYRRATEAPPEKSVIRVMRWGSPPVVEAEPFDPRDLPAEPTARLSRFQRHRSHGGPKNRIYLD